MVRGALADGAFSAFYVDAGRVTGALSVGRSADLEHARRLMASGARVDEASLASADVDLAEL